MKLLPVILLLTTAAFAGQTCHRGFAVVQHDQNIVVANIPDKKASIIFDTIQLCIGTQAEMDKGGIACYDAVPIPVPAGLRLSPKLPIMMGIPDSMLPGN